MFCMGLNRTYNHIPRYFVSRSLMSYDHQLWTLSTHSYHCISLQRKKKSLKYTNNFHTVCLVSKDRKPDQQKEKQISLRFHYN